MGSKSNSKKKSDNGNIYMWLCYITAGVIPLLVHVIIRSSGLGKYDWFAANDTEYDFFQGVKMWAVIITGIIMVGVILWQLYRKSNIYLPDLMSNKAIWACMTLYLAMALVSSVFADVPSAAFFGGYSQHESFFALLAYGIIMLYTYMFTRKEQDLVRFVEVFMFFVLIIAGIGCLQYMGNDFFMSDAGKSVITMFSSLDADRLSLSFGEGWVYMTLYNPNYVGSYVVLALPVMLAGVWVAKKIWQKVIMGLVAAMLLVCLVGASSATGMVVVIFTVLLFAALCLTKAKKYRRYVIAGLGGVAVVGIVVAVINSDTIVKTVGKFSFAEDTSLISAINLEGDSVEITYRDKQMYVTNEIMGDGSVKIVIRDDMHKSIDFKYDESSGVIYSDDEFYSGISFKAVSIQDGILGFCVMSGDTSFTFTNGLGDGRYYYYNAYGKLTRDIVKADHIGFDRHEAFATNRGFIWSRSLALLRDNIIFGCGPDNFVYHFPNNDYVALANNTFTGQVVTRPHNMYLQIGVQTGIISLIAILVLYVVYFIQSIIMIRRTDSVTPAVVIAMAILSGSFGYMLCAVAYDSTIAVAPVFWTLLGLGLACNRIIINRR